MILDSIILASDLRFTSQIGEAKCLVETLINTIKETLLKFLVQL